MNIFTEPEEFIINLQHTKYSTLYFCDNPIQKPTSCFEWLTSCSTERKIGCSSYLYLSSLQLFVHQFRWLHHIAMRSPHDCARNQGRSFPSCSTEYKRWRMILRAKILFSVRYSLFLVLLSILF